MPAYLPASRAEQSLSGRYRSFGLSDHRRGGLFGKRIGVVMYHGDA